MIYLDNQATTPTDPRVVEAMLPYFNNLFANPHSTQHEPGNQAKQAVDVARQQIANLCGANRDEIYFTSGATESNNLAVRGLAPTLLKNGRTHIICSNIEHKCVLAAVELLKGSGFRIDYVPCGQDGVVSAASISERITPETGLVCLMSANNEIGTLQPIGAVGKLCQASGIALHVDAVQSLGKHDLNLHSLGVTTASFSAHKLYGPKGIGAIFVARKWRSRITPLIVGGGQEGGLRSGTLPVPLCVGFGRACEVAAEQMSSDQALMTHCRSTFLAVLAEEKIPFQINASMEHRLSGNISLSIAGVDSEALIMTLKDRVALSSGSACTTAEIEPSHVLLALGLPPERIECSVRISFGRFTDPAQAEAAARIIAEVASGLRRIRH